MIQESTNWKGRLRAATIHLAACCVIALLAASLVFLVWYPYPYSELSRGSNLFWLIVGVDVTLGPLLTLIIFNTAKPIKVLQLDIGLVVLIQITALAYGLWTMAVARPVYLVFELDRFRVVHAVEVDDELLQKAPSPFNTLPWFDQGILAVRPIAESERLDVTLAALEGAHLAFRPDFWQPYADAADKVRQAAKPIGTLKKRFAAHGEVIDQTIKQTGRPENRLLTLPLISREEAWTILLDSETLEVAGFVPIDSF